MEVKDFYCAPFCRFPSWKSLFEEVPCDSVQAPANPDARYNGRRSQGYLVQVMEGYRGDEGEGKFEGTPNIITHGTVSKMTGYDSAQLAPAMPPRGYKKSG